MMVWSHFEAMRTNPGYLPEYKERLYEELFPKDSQFYDIIREREDIYHEYVVRLKITKGELKSFAEHSGKFFNVSQKSNSSINENDDNDEPLHFNRQGLQ
jgi:hypothetical protein